MKILAVDNEPLQLKLLEDTIHAAAPEAGVFAFNNSLNALEWAKQERPEIAFLDISMPVLNGIQLAKEMKMLDPKVNLVFVTGYFEDYVLDAIPLRFSGYLQKPVKEEAVRYELEHLRYPLPVKKTEALLTVRCFGTFEVFLNGEIVNFSRKKTKEFFAFLVDRKGSSVDMNTLCASLYDDEMHEKNNKSDLRKCVADLNHSLEAIGAESIFVKGFNSYAINPKLISCDFYDWEKNEPYAIRAFHGEYMSQYSWAEETLAGLVGYREDT